MQETQTKKSLFIFSLLIIFSFSFFVFAQENSTSNTNIFLDSDQDGLSNEEEVTYGTDPNSADTDNDGYTDGTEVKTGYDPLKPAPGDKLDTNTYTAATNNQTEITETENMTRDVSSQLLTLVNSNTSQENVSIEDLDSIINSALGSSVSVDDLPEIDIEKEIKILESDYSDLSDEEKKIKEKDDNLQYITSISYIAVNNFPTKVTSESDMAAMGNFFINQFYSLSNLQNQDTSYFNDIADRGEIALQQMKEVAVPKDMLDLHIEGMRIAKYAISLENSVTPNMNDPIGSITSLSKMQSAISLGLGFSAKISQKLIGLGITTIPVDL